MKIFIQTSTVRSGDDSKALCATVVSSLKTGSWTMVLRRLGGISDGLMNGGGGRLERGGEEPPWALL